MISINTKETGETIVHIIAATIAEAIQKLDRARAALWELDEDPAPVTPTGEILTADELQQCINRVGGGTIAPVADSQETPKAISQPPTPPAPKTDEQAPGQMQIGDNSQLLATTQPDHVPSQEASGQPPSRGDQPLDIPLSPDNPKDYLPTAEELCLEIAAVGLRLFGEDWTRAHTWLVQLWTKAYTPAQPRNSVEQLTAEECSTILQGMIDHAAETKQEWQKHLQNEAINAQHVTQQAQRRVVGRQPRTQQPPRRPAAPPTQSAATADHAVDAVRNPVYATG